MKFFELNKENTSSFIVKLLISWIIIISLLLSFNNLYAVDYMMISFVLLVTTIQILFSYSRFNKYWVTIEIGILIALIVIMVNQFVDGGLITANYFINIHNHYSNNYIQLYQVSGSNVLFVYVVFALISQGITYLVSKRKLYLITIIGFSLVFISSFFHLSSYIWGLIGMLFGVLSNWLNVTGFTLSIKSRITLQSFLLVVLALLIFSTNGYQMISDVDNLRRDIEETVEVTRFGKDTLTRGDLSKYNKLNTSDDDTLKLSFDVPTSVYLKGYVGSVYNGNNWETLDKSIYYNEYNGMLDWLSTSKSFDTLTQYSQYESLVEDDSTSYKLSVTNNGASSKYLYLPYGTSSTDTSFDYDYDYDYKSNNFFGDKDYSIEAISNSSNELKTISANYFNSQGNYVDAENVYRYFVYKNYVTVDDKLKEMLQGYFFGEDYDQNNKDLYTVTTRIRTILSLLTKYDKTPAVYNGDDFVEWFLNTSKKGNAISYASSAVMAYRTMGIPARYVEGYYLAQNQVDQMNSKGKNSIQLTDEDAHAWVEVYIDGVGWLPIEVTPGFYTNALPVNEVVGTPEQKPVAVDPNKETANDYFEYKEASKPIPEKIIDAVVNTAIYISFAMIGLFGILVLLEAQRLIRIIYYQCVIKTYDDEQYVRYYYNEMMHCLVFYDYNDSNKDYPYTLLKDNQSELINFDALNKSIGIFQQVIFGDLPIEKYQRRIIESSLSDLQKDTSKKLNLFKKFIWRYRYLK